MRNPLLFLFPWLLPALLLTGLAPPARGDEAKGGYNQMVQEYQLKYQVPPEVADSLWHYLLRHYRGTGLRRANPKFSAEASTETYVDEYYDDAAYTLMRHQHSLRRRMVFAGKGVDRHFLQLKISRRPRQRFLRQEWKFNLNDRPDKRGHQTGHPFWRLVRGSDRQLIDSLLQDLQIDPDQLRPVMELHQQRRRLYLRDRGNELVYISLDAVNAQNPEAGFLELELALNEQTYTAATPAQRQNLRHVLELLQLDITNKFPGLRQDPTPKYNRMYMLQQGHRIRPRGYNLAWIAIGVLLGGLSWYLYRHRNDPPPKEPEML